VEGAAGSRHDPAVTFRNPCYQLTFPIVRTMVASGRRFLHGAEPAHDGEPCRLPRRSCSRRTPVAAA